MNPQLQVLIALQDILLLIREAQDPSRKRAFGKMGFKLTNLDALEETKSDLEGQLSPSILSEYGRAREHLVKSLKLDPSQGSTYFALALVDEKLKNYPEALENWNKFLVLTKNNKLKKIAQKHIDLLERIYE